MTTMQGVCDKGRVPLNDSSKDRFTDAFLLSLCQDGIIRAYTIRPDLRFGNYSTADNTRSLALTDTFPLPDAYVELIADYIVFRAETPSDESVDTNRAITFMNLFEKALLS